MRSQFLIAIEAEMYFIYYVIALASVSATIATMAVAIWIDVSST